VATDRGRSLRLELIASLAIVLVMAVVSLSFAAEVLGQKRHRDLEMERLEQHTRGLASLVASSGLREGNIDRIRLQPILQQNFGSQQELDSIELLAVERESGIVTPIVVTGLPDGSLPPPVGTRSAREIDHRVVLEEPVPAVQSHDTTYVVRVTARRSPWTRGADWRVILIVATGVALVLLVLGTMLVEAQVIRPLRALSRAHEQVTRGDMQSRLSSDGSLEFRAVYEGFNQMVEALESQRATLDSQSTRLQRSEHMAAVGRLSAGVAHEVGNPLAALVGYTDILLDEKLDDAARELLERIRGQTQRIQSIVSQLLDYSRQRARKLECVDVEPLLAEVAALVRADPRARGVTVTVADCTATAWGDEGLLVQVVLNLALNAARSAREHADANPESTPTIILTATGGDPVRVSVADNGDGVPHEIRPRVFEPFFTTQPAGEGTGLGLAISQGLTESMGGEIECLEHGEFDPPEGGGSGACFRITLAATAPATRSRAALHPIV